MNHLLRSFVWAAPLALVLASTGCGGGGSGTDDEICANGADDDGDGAVDCADTDCTGHPSCSGQEVCDDGQDNDGDGDADCADADCANDAACAQEICTDGIDNDGDGDEDCADADCMGQASCLAYCTSPTSAGDPSTQLGNTDGQPGMGAGSCQQAGSAAAVYQVTPQNGDVLELTLTSDANLGIYVQSTCGETATELGCADVASGDSAVERLVLSDVTPGEPLYVFVAGAAAEQAGAFTLSVESRPITCGDDRVDGIEECDDGNTEPGDGCDASCQAEWVLESEPNEDGSPEPGGSIQGNDFDSGNANGPFSSDTVIAAAITPAGDEDVFEIANDGAFPASVRLDLFVPDLGIGVACDDSVDTQLHVRDADGTQLASNDDRIASTDPCSGLDLIIPPGSSVFAHVLDFGDNEEIQAYLLRVSFAACGDGVREGLEQCDDGNNDPDDGCNGSCQIEATCGNEQVEPGEQCDDGNTTPGDGCDANCQIETNCGNGLPDPGEQCDDGNRMPGDGCDANCRIETTCGDNTIEGDEQCDDGNTDTGDGCDADCQVESTPESEPNDDGTPGNTGLGTAGDDFDAGNANGPFTADTIIAAALDPGGDEDVFAITNDDAFASSVRFDLYNAGLGFGEVCGTTIDTGLNLRDAAGSLLASNDNRDGSADRCSGLDFIIAAGETVYVHVTDFGDNSVVPGYYLDLHFATCGDGFTEGLEQCDDNNNDAGDGCDPNCVSE